MENLSRKLEDEIKTHSQLGRGRKKSRTGKKSILVIDDSGTIRSADWIKTVIGLLMVAGLAAAVAAVVLLSLYREARSGNVVMSGQLAEARQRIVRLVSEKEMLMANLVMDGRLPAEFKTPVPQGVSNAVKIKGKQASNSTSAVKETSEQAKLPRQPDDAAGGMPARVAERLEEGLHLSGRAEQLEDVTGSMGEDAGEADDSRNSTDPDMLAQLDDTIRIEDFRLSADQTAGTLEVRFDIRKLSGNKASGHAFVILKSDLSDTSQWVSIPGDILKDGRPADPDTGQYFSITNFKPMRFKLQSEDDPSVYKQATVVIYEAKSLGLMFEKDIEISIGDQN